MIKDIKKHKTAYSLLTLISALFLTSVFLLRHNLSYLLLITITFSGLYLIWGIVHHLSEHNLTFKIMLEYFLVSALGVIIMSTLLL